ncbi:MAG: tandem-95 repeat protein [Bacillota bacterium]
MFSGSPFHFGRVRWLLIAVLLVGSLLVTAPAAEAATYVVNKFTDSATDPCDGVGDCSLRSAIIKANSNTGGDIIHVPTGTYTLTIAGAGENLGATGDLDITDSVTIIGSGGNADGSPGATVIEAGSADSGNPTPGPGRGIDRVFHVKASSAISVSIKAVTIQYGTAARIVDGSTVVDEGYGGGVAFETDSAYSSLTLYNVVVDSNSTVEPTYMAGGAGVDLYNIATTPLAPVTIEKSVISNNYTTTGDGGGIHAAYVNLTLKDSTVSGNTTSNGAGGYASGGGLLIANSDVSIQRSAFIGNTAYGHGGAISVVSGTVSIKDSTFSGNSGNNATSRGGAIHYDYSAGKSLTLTNATLTANSAATGGGLYKGTDGTVTLQNTIVYGNTATTSPEIHGALDTANSYNNIVDSDGTGGLTNGTNNNKVGVDPLLRTLGNYGGPTQTHALAFGSPAQDGGSNTYASALDQRGQTRILDSAIDADTTQTVDIGAFETHPSLVDIPPQNLSGSTVTVSFTVADGSKPITVTGTSSNGEVVANSGISGSVSGSTATLTITPLKSGVTTITATVTDSSNNNVSISDQFELTVTVSASPPSVTSATTSEETQSTSGLVISPVSGDTNVSHFKITNITNGRLFQNNGSTEITNGTFITLAEGQAGLKFTPSQDKNSPGGDSFSFDVQAAYDSAGAGLSTATTATITVTEENDAPIATADSLSSQVEDSGPWTISTASLLANDTAGPSNEGGQSLTVTAVAAGTGGSVTLSGTDVIFTPAANFSGAANFTYTVTDNGTTNTVADPKSASATASFTVTPVADTPSVTNATTEEDTQSSSGLVITRNAADGAEVTHFQISGITGGTLYKNNGSTTIGEGEFITFDEGNAGLKFLPSLNLNSDNTATFGFTVKAATDEFGAGLSNGTTASITVTAANDPPVGGTDTASAVLEDSAGNSIAMSTLLANDTPGPTSDETETLTITAVTPGTGTASVTIDGTDVLFTPEADYYGTATFTYTLQDSGSAPNTATVTVNVPVTPVADIPSVTPATTAEDTQSDAGLVISRNAVDGAEVTHFEISGITGGRLYKNDGATEILAGDYITAAEAGAGLKFTPSADLNGTTGFGFTVKAATNSSGAGISDGTTASITVTGVNDEPTGVNDTLASVAEDSGPRTIPFATLIGNDLKGPSDESGQTLTVTGVSAPTGGTAAISGTDVIFTPSADFNGTASFTYTVTDNGTTGGLSDPKSGTANANFTITPVNDAPTGTNDTLTSVGEDSAPRSIPFADLLGNDSPGPADESGQALTITAVSNPTGGTVSISGTSVVFTLTANFSGTASFDYTLRDDGTTNGAADPLTATASASFTVAPAAEAPTVTAATTAEDTQSTSGLVITRNAADGAEVTHFQISAITGGTLYQNNGSTVITDGAYIPATEGNAGLKFTPSNNLNGTTGFGFTVKAALDDSGTGISDGTTVAIVVTEENDAPTGVDDTLTSRVEDSGPWTIPGASLTGNDLKGPSDESGQSLTVTAADSAVGGSVSVDLNGDVIFTPAANFYGPASFRYTLADNGTTSGVADPKTGTAIASFVITAAADEPQVTATTTAEETQSASGLVITRNAVDGAEVTHFQLSGITGGRLYKNDGNTEILEGAYITAAEGTAGLRFTPGADLNGTAFGFTVKGALDASGTGLSSGTAASITVTEVNDAPTGANDALTLLEDSGPWTIPFSTLLSNDSAGPANESDQSLTISAAAGASGGTVALSGSNVIFTPTADHNGTASFTYTLADDGATNGVTDPKSDTATVTITIPAVNDPPVGADDTLADVVEDAGPWTISFAALLANDSTGPADEGGQSLTIISVGEAVGGTAAIAGTDVIFTPTPDFTGTASFTYTLEDNGTTDGGADPKSDTAAATFTVTPVNDAPVAQDSIRSVTVGATLKGTVTATDVDGDPLTFSVVGAPTRGTVTMTAAGAFSYVGTSTGTDTFTYKANDTQTDSNIATVTITINAVPPPPPVLTLTVPTTLTRESSITASGTTGSYNSVVVNGTTVHADSSGQWSATVALVEGENQISASDGYSTRSVTVVRDSTPPLLTLNASTSKTRAESTTLTAVSEEGARVLIEGQETLRLTVSLQMGANTFTAIATDAAGNQATASVTVVRTARQIFTVPVDPDQGGRVEADFVTVEIPANATPSGIVLVVAEPEDEGVDQQVLEAAALVVRAEVNAYTLEGNQPVRQLNRPVRLIFPYDPARVTDPGALRIYYYDPETKVWVELGGVVDTEAHTVSVTVNHLTLFAVMAPKLETPQIDPLPEAVTSAEMTATGQGTPGATVTLHVNGEAQSSATVGTDGRFRLAGTLKTGSNRVYVTGGGLLASREQSVVYEPFPYTDLDDHWAQDAIRRLYDHNVVTIYEGERFLPEEKVTRLEFAIMVARVLRLAPESTAPPFSDRDQMAAWALPEVSAAVKAGIILGMPDGSFAPDEPVTRAQMALMLTRALKYAGLDIAPGDRVFTDAAEIPDWAKSGVLTAARYGLITGYPDGSFQPTNSTTRAEAVTMLNRLLNAVWPES